MTITKHHIVSKRQSVINTVAAAVPYDQLLATTDILFREYQARTLQYKLANIVGNVQQKAANTNQSDIGFVGTGKSVTQTINTAVATANRDGKGISIADLTRIRATFEQQGFDSKMDGFCLAVPPHIYSSLLSEPNFVRADSVGSAPGHYRGRDRLSIWYKDYSHKKYALCGERWIKMDCEDKRGRAFRCYPRPYLSRFCRDCRWAFFIQSEVGDSGCRYRRTRVFFVCLGA